MKGKTLSGKKLAAAFPLTVEEKRGLEGVALRVWDEIGGDVLNALAEERGGDQSVSVKKAEVVELVIDANRLEDAVKRSKELWASPRVKALFPDFRSETWRDASTALSAIVKGAFPFARYGW